MCEKNCMDEKLSNEMKELLKKYSQDKSNLIQILNEVQEISWANSFRQWSAAGHGCRNTALFSQQGSYPVSAVRGYRSRSYRLDARQTGRKNRIAVPSHR